jgi:hypothetical protein
MTFRELKQTLLTISEDAGDAESYLEHNIHSQFARRVYVRSIFSGIEGTLFLLKTVCLNAKTNNELRKISIAEYIVLKEEAYELNNNGEPLVQDKFFRLPENLKFTFRIINKLFNAKIDLNLKGNHWNEFLSAIKVRNRITHPKKVDSLLITDSEIEMCKNSSLWFNDITIEAIEAIWRIGRSLDKEEDNSIEHI